MFTRVRSRKTTATAVIAGVAIVATAVSDAFKDGWQVEDVSLIAAGIAVAALGFFSRDDNVSSERTRVPK